MKHVRVPVRFMYPDGQYVDLRVPYESVLLFDAVLDASQPEDRDYTVIIGNPHDPMRVGTLHKTPAKLIRDCASLAGWDQ